MKSKTDNGNLRAVLYHEMGHALDNNVNKEYSYGNKFEKAIQDDYSYQTRHDFTEELSSVMLNLTLKRLEHIVKIGLKVCQ